jgi:hypothetical protein
MKQNNKYPQYLGGTYWDLCVSMFRVNNCMLESLKTFKTFFSLASQRDLIYKRKLCTRKTRQTN